MALHHYRHAAPERPSWAEDSELPTTWWEWIVLGASALAALFGLALILHRYM